MRLKPPYRTALHLAMIIACALAITLPFAFSRDPVDTATIWRVADEPWQMLPELAAAYDEFRRLYGIDVIY